MSSSPRTDLASWKALEGHSSEIKNTHLNTLFAEDSQRAEIYSISLNDLYFDFSKNKITDNTLGALKDLADECDLEQKRDALFSGENLNITENRPALHMALRGSTAAGLTIDGTDIQNFVADTLTQMHKIYADLNARKDIKHIVNIGIGGSDLGPKMVCAALQPYDQKRFHLHFVSNVDPSALNQVFEICAPEETIFIIASKSFTTQETLANALAARDWMQGALPQNWPQHFYGITGKNNKAIDFGIPETHLLPLPDWVGGRYSLWGSIGLPIFLQIGPQHFQDFLSGAHEADAHFKSASFNQNIPMMMGMLGVWNTNFLGASAHAILPYDHHLSHFPSFIQQIDMESNGKSVTCDGEHVSYQTGPVIFGETGTNGQHAFYQSLHQGAQIIPCDFIVAQHSHTPIADHQEKLIANALGQARALMVGDQTPENAHQYFAGNRPSNFFLIKKLTPFMLGLIIALYEHKIFVQGMVWNINSFDQWGVQLGKDLADDILDAMSCDSESVKSLDPSSRSLLNRLS